MYIPTNHLGSPENILHAYHTLPKPLILKGQHWYEDQNAFLASTAQRYDLPPQVVFAVVAALSPAIEWEHNLNAAMAVISLGTCRFYRGFKGRLQQAEAILKLRNPALLTGPKCQAFYRNLLYPDQAGPVTIDRHAIAIWLGVKRPAGYRCSDAHCETIAEDYRIAAYQADLLPHQMQGATWFAFKFKTRPGIGRKRTVESEHERDQATHLPA